MLNKDKRAVGAWLRAGYSHNDCMRAERMGLVENERFTYRAKEVYVVLWAWSAYRFEGDAGRAQDALYYRGGIEAVSRRIARCQRLIERIKRHW